MRLGIVFFSLLIFQNASFGQMFPSDIWYDGKVYIDSVETITGQIKYDFDNDVIYVNVDNLLKTFSTRKFSSFEIKNTDNLTVRTFYSFLYQKISDYKVPMLFELIKDGKSVSLLTREFVTTESIPQFDYYTRRNYYYTRNVLAYHYYFLFPSSKIRQYHLNRNELLDLLKDKSSEIKKYLKENRLRYDRREDLIQIIDYYNSLKNN